MRTFVQVNWWLDLEPSQQFEHTARRRPDAKTPPITLRVQQIEPGVLGVVHLKGPRIRKDGSLGGQDRVRVLLEDLRHTAPTDVKRSYLSVRAAVRAFHEEMDQLDVHSSAPEDHPAGE